MPEVCSVVKIKKRVKNKMGTYAATPLITQELANQVTQSVVYFSQKVKCIEGVTKFAYTVKGNIITLWTFIDSPTPEDLKKIHAVEMDTIDKHKDISFDFTVIFKGRESSPTGFDEILL